MSESLDTLNEVETWDAALKAYRNKNFHMSLNLFSRIPDTARLVTNMALIYSTMGQHEAAIEQLTKAIYLDQYLAVAYFQRGASHYLLKRYNSALKDFDQALAQIRGGVYIDYEPTKPKFHLSSEQVSFNKGLTLIELGRKADGLSVFLEARQRCASDMHDVIEDAINSSGRGSVLYTIPVGVLYRPSENLVKVLSQDTPAPSHPAGFQYSLQSPSNNSLCTLQQSNASCSVRESYSGPKTDASSTYVPSVYSRTISRKSSTTSTYKSFASSTPDIASNSWQSTKPTRSELNKVLGEDNITSTTEITTIPCAGLRISYGSLAGLMAWRFFVELDEPSPKYRPKPGVISNFILDTGSSHSPVPPETLKALGYKGSLSPGTEVILHVQGVRTKCVVAYPEEAGRLCGQFMMAGSLTLYFDTMLDAPVLYVAEEDLGRPKSNSIPRTVKLPLSPPSGWPVFVQRIMSMTGLSRAFP